MTSYPYGQQQYSPTPQPTGLRPGSVTALAIVGIVFGGLGLLCKPLSVLLLFMPQPQPNPAIEMQKGMMPWNLSSAGVGTLISALLLAASIGSLMLKPWARKGMLAYAALAVVMNVVGLVVTLVWIMPKMKDVQQQMIQQQGGAAAPPGMANMMQTLGSVGTIVGFVLAMVFPVLIGYFFTRDNVKAAFEGGGVPPGPIQGGGYPAPGAYAPPGQYPPYQQ